MQYSSPPDVPLRPVKTNTILLLVLLHLSLDSYKKKGQGAAPNSSLSSDITISNTSTSAPAAQKV